MTGLQLAVALLSAAAEPLPVSRHIGRWGRIPSNCPTGGASSLSDAPFIGNGGLGVMMCGKQGGPHAYGPNHTSFFLASNEFWNSNPSIDSRPAGPPLTGAEERFLTPLKEGN